MLKVATNSTSSTCGVKHILRRLVALKIWESGGVSAEIAPCTNQEKGERVQKYFQISDKDLSTDLCLPSGAI